MTDGFRVGSMDAFLALNVDDPVFQHGASLVKFNLSSTITYVLTYIMDIHPFKSLVCLDYVRAF